MRVKQTEAGFQRAVVQLAKLHGWRVAAFRPAQVRSGRWVTPMQGDVGWPDLFLAHAKRGEALAAELKVGKNKLSQPQCEWVAALEAAGVRVYLWKPEMWDGIVEVLRG